ncbi:ABC transporter substrate-binding protein [Sporolactobacillus shoreicorticis]|uniref:PotD/PotF family extracellular solute-binding protein n=1 Tax=Sporolactobacillus shoreicorticis TaxID=1923877 RepID=A0ABW5S391_9BACL|nr:ABC transporter substrate-binding protein [Sporolactobacillus shoreicorticis]MCO7125794.1 ABC transporter substrate-binding protein [Sporolactobacillus shoreicorticis]
MKKLMIMLIAVLVIVLALSLVSAKLTGSTTKAGAKTLTIYNWGDYIDPALIAKFEKQYGYRVVYQTFDSNEAMLTKIQQGGTSFDLVVPSDYMISKMRDEHLLLPINSKKVPNLKNIDSRFLNLSFDPANHYSVPYFWGTVGIVYNPKMLGGSKITSWNDLWNKKYRNQILLVDSAREIVGMGLNSLHYSVNDTNKKHLKQTLQKLKKLTPNIKAIVGDENKLLLPRREAAIGVLWSGDAVEIMDENPELTYVIPKEGSNVWFDNMAIPKGATNKKGAEQFINFMLDPKNAAKNAEYVGYATPNREAIRYLPKKIKNDKRFYPDKKLTDRLEVYDNFSKPVNARFNELFLEFKMNH